MLKFIIRSLKDSEHFGRILGKYSKQGDVILLTGNLGAGKTTLTQFIAKGLDVPADNYVTSPSFSLMNQYLGRIPLYHIDCYRLEGEDDVEGSGLIDYIVADGLTVIEWPDRLESLVPPDRLDINIQCGEDEERYLSLTAYGKRWLERMNVINNACQDAGLMPGK